MSISLLEEFVWSLDKNERTKLKPLKFRGKKRQLLFALLKQKAGRITSKETGRKKAVTSQLHSMRSELLEYCYCEICPEYGLQLLTFLIERGLYRHFARELSKIEEDILAAGEREMIEHFYLEVVKLINLIPLVRLTNEVVWEKLRTYPAKYIASKQQILSDDYLLPEIFQLGLDIRRAINEHKPPELIKKIEHRLHKIDKETTGSENIYLRISLNRRMIVFYKNVKVDFEKVAALYQKEAFYFSNDSKITKFVSQNMSGLYSAELAYFNSDFDLAYSFFTTELHKKEYPLRSWPVLYAQMYVLVCHIKDELSQSQMVLHERFLYFLDFYHSPHAVLSCVLLGRQHYYLGEYTLASYYVGLGFQKNLGSMYDPIHDLDLKLLENALVFVEGDIEKAHSLALANIRACARRGYQLKTARLPHFFKAIEELSDSLLLGKEIAHKTKERVEKFTVPFVYPRKILDKIVHLHFPNESLSTK